MKIIFTFLLFGLAFSQSFAQPGTIDNYFGTNGKTMTAIGQNDFAKSIAVQIDGKIIAAGTSQGNDNAFRFALVRYDTHGTPDNTFGTNGTVLTQLGSRGDDEIDAIALQKDGKIVVAGSSAGSFISYSFALARYNTDGTLDSTFGFYHDGKTLSFIQGYEHAYAVAIQGDGKIVAAGSSSANNYTSRFALFRYNSNGTIDTTFGTDGSVTTAFGTNSDIVLSIAIQSDGKIVAAGQTYGENNGSSDIALARYNSDGSLDNSFGTNGKLTTSFGSGRSAAYAVELQIDGKIVVAGDSSYQLESSSSFAVVRYNINGTLDNSFDGDGKATTSFSNADDIGRALAIQSDGKLVVAGYTANPNGSEDFALARYTTTGSLDTSFNGNGKTTLDFGKQDRGFALKLFGKQIFVSGSTSRMTSGNSFALAAFQNDATALPISLTSFAASRQNTAVHLTWKVAGEQNISMFELERSTNGEMFEKVGVVKASGVILSEPAYSLTDDIKSVSNFTNIYYRLKMLDADGKFVYSKVIILKLGAILNGLQIFSNPVKDVLQIQATGANETAILQITDAAGRIVKHEKVQLIGTTSIVLNVQSLSSGIFYLVLQTRDNKLVKSFVK